MLENGCGGFSFDFFDYWVLPQMIQYLIFPSFGFGRKKGVGRGGRDSAGIVVIL